MVIEIEVRVINPDWSALTEGNESQLLAKAGDQVKPRCDVVAELLVRGCRALEDDRRGDVHMGACPLHVQKGRIQPTKSILAHRPIFAQPAGLGSIQIGFDRWFCGCFVSFAV